MNANLFLVAAFLVIAVSFLRHRHRTRAQWRQVGAMMDAIARGERPTSFILHGEKPFRRLGLGLETLADQRDRLESQISREGFNLQAILASMREGVMVVDTDRVIRLVNGSFLNLFHLQTPPVGRDSLTTLRDAEVEGVLRQVLAEGQPQSREIALHHPTRHLAMSAAPVRDQAGGILGAAVTFHDITRIHQLEEVRRDFVANVSHELRTPLSIFQGYVEMLRDNPELPREEIGRTLQILAKHSTRLNALVEDLLTLARLESRGEELEREAIDPAGFLRGVETDWKLKFQATSIRFGVEIAPDLPALCGDAFRLEQVFNNLLENALKYTPAQGAVTLQARRGTARDGTPGAEVEIVVHDTGSGIPVADLPHIFERFYRADKARSRALGGTGLGLSIVKHIVRSHGGSVRAESKVGEGTTFFIRLPGAVASTSAL
ncbi:MAG: ATP-binding protein [Chthoniobacteraceae bacterium]|nr:ATP-binding protein [Chthoniobacteraceae bacterium]